MTSPPRVTMLVNGGMDSPTGHRAQTLAARLQPSYQIEIAYRSSKRARSIATFFSVLRHQRPAIVYVFDLGISGISAALAYRAATGCPLVVDTGDAFAAILQATGRLGRLGYEWAKRYEQAVLRGADHVVVRGTLLRELALRAGAKGVTFVPDGVDVHHYRPLDARALRVSLGAERRFTVGVLGNLHWDARRQWCYGVELIEALSRLQATPLIGLVIGNGSGLPRLQQLARERGIVDGVRFLGYKPHTSLPQYINAMDVCLSTQTNDIVGQVRTTAKLPVYLACGRFVLASRVGEAARILPEEMLVEYVGSFDPMYPSRLAERIEQILKEPELLALGQRGRVIAEAEFDYGILVPRVATVLRSVLDTTALRW